MRENYTLSTGPSHDPETGEVRQEEDDTSARASPAGPAASGINPEAAGSTPAITPAATANIQFLAREAAKRGREQLKTYFKGLPAEGKRIVTLMQAELEELLGPKPQE
jgi:hypothetical protein